MHPWLREQLMLGLGSSSRKICLYGVGFAERVGNDYFTILHRKRTYLLLPHMVGSMEAFITTKRTKQKMINT